MTVGAANARPRKRALAGWLARLAVSAVVLALIFSFVPVDEVWREARRIPPVLWLAGLSAFLAGHAVGAAKWRLLIGPGVSYPEAFRAHLAGLAANLCLPGVAGGDMVRAGLVLGKAGDRARLAAGSLADRLLDTLALLIIAGSAALLAFEAPAAPRQLIFAGAALAIAAGLGLAAFGAAAAWARSRPAHRIARALARGASAAAGLAREPGRLAACLAASVAIQSLFIGVNIAFAAAARLEAPAAAWFFAWSSAKIIAIAPISLGGLGVREASMAGLLAPFGAEPARVIAVGLIWQTVLYAAGLIGLVLQTVWTPRGAAANPAPSPGVSLEVKP